MLAQEIINGLRGNKEQGPSLWLEHYDKNIIDWNIMTGYETK